MKNIIISIAKPSILENVSLNTSYVGAKSRNDSLEFDKVATISEDDTLLTRFWVEMCGVVTDRLKEFIVSSTGDSEKLSITLELSNAYDESLSPSVKDDVFSAIAAGVTARWLQYTLPERASEWHQSATSLLERSFSKLCQRRKPSRNQNQ